MKLLLSLTKNCSPNVNTLINDLNKCNYPIFNNHFNQELKIYENICLSVKDKTYILKHFTILNICCTEIYHLFLFYFKRQL